MKDIKGLSNKEVEERINNNLTNEIIDVSTNTIPKIIIKNVFTLFNILNIVLAIIVLFVGSYKNTLFLGVVVCNILISTIQEIRSKKIIDKLNIIKENKVSVIRDGVVKKISISSLVLDDIYMLKQGSQVVVDSIIIDGNVSLDESFLTGEQEAINYKEGDLILSGSYVLSGKCVAKVKHIKQDNYVNTIALQAKYVKVENSVILKSLKQIIKIVSVAIIPLGILLFINQYKINYDISSSIINTVAAIIGMIPEGLILLTSTVLAVSVIRLSKINVLTQDLYSVEMLARVDTICFDKTGTITSGNMKVEKIVPLKNVDVYEIMGNIVSNMDINNSTSKALNNYFKKYDNYTFVKRIDFSPITKYSGIVFKDKTYIIGAPEIIYKKEIPELKNYKDKRVILLCENEENSIPIALIVLEDEIRKNAYKMIDYLNKENIDIKIISGDGIDNVLNIAKKVNLKNLKAVDISIVDDLSSAVLNNNIFVRATPIQKKEIIKILKDNKHCVAFAGDGVNDVLALKESDCGITINSGSEMAKNVSEIVILDDDFNSIPSIIKEGRRSINNLERSATLFLSKTIYSSLLALLFIFINKNYPFEPIQLTLTSVFTIGIPSFILALEPNDEIVSGSFLNKVFKRSIPSALTIVMNILFLTFLSDLFHLDTSQVSTLCVIMTAFTGFLLLFRLCMPFNKLRIFLIVFLLLGFSISVLGLRTLFSLTILNLKMFLFIVILVLLSTLVFNILNVVVSKIFKEEV